MQIHDQGEGDVNIMPIEDKDFLMRQLKQVGASLGSFLSKDSKEEILNFGEKQADLADEAVPLAKDDDKSETEKK